MNVDTPKGAPLPPLLLQVVKQSNSAAQQEISKPDVATRLRRLRYRELALVCERPNRRRPRLPKSRRRPRSEQKRPSGCASAFALIRSEPKCAEQNPDIPTDCDRVLSGVSVYFSSHLCRLLLSSPVSYSLEISEPSVFKRRVCEAQTLDERNAGTGLQLRIQFTFTPRPPSRDPPRTCYIAGGGACHGRRSRA
ncbi:hypothetical protein AOLI_G00024680 [Acnodon oligacanthus]